MMTDPTAVTGHSVQRSDDVILRVHIIQAGERQRSPLFAILRHALDHHLPVGLGKRQSMPRRPPESAVGKVKTPGPWWLPAEIVACRHEDGGFIRMEARVRAIWCWL